jgi:hypothetical protein
MQEITIEIGYGGRTVKVAGKTKKGERVIIPNAEEIILEALNYKGFNLHKGQYEKLNRAIIKN